MRIITAGLLFFLAMTAWAQAPEEAASVIRGQIQAFAEGNAETAYEFASDGIQQQFESPGVFIDMVREQYPALYQPRYLTFSEPLVVSDERIHQELMVVDRRGQSWQAWYSLVSSRDAWRIEGVFLQPAPQQAI